ncbi:UNKNOWN [Stylonychia lemnae]|uniref:Transmembrane protein n=1 Tax=Stylonychia lemnae TaxID=5949 RepID=A0A078A8H2_STYLE|nr:UNKNOWN [Stylonychia lemnae]|eukprot:CDW78560.1 UNKNOWN [Stylonychia lemnae]
MLLFVKSTYNLIVLTLSVLNFCLVCKFISNTEALSIKSSPKALTNLQEIFLPPMLKLQSFVLLFDLFVGIYYIYQWPLWDKIKSKFVYYQYEARTAEKQDCSNLFLSILFILLSKVSIIIFKLKNIVLTNVLFQGLSLVILISVQTLSINEIAKINNEYANENQDTQVFFMLQLLRETLDALVAESQKAEYGKVLNTILGFLLLISFVLNLATINMPLLEKKHNSLLEQTQEKIHKKFDDSQLSSSEAAAGHNNDSHYLNHSGQHNQSRKTSKKEKKNQLL